MINLTVYGSRLVRVSKGKFEHKLETIEVELFDNEDWRAPLGFTVNGIKVTTNGRSVGEIPG
jgi:hypothetical protein